MQKSIEISVALTRNCHINQSIFTIRKIGPQHNVTLSRMSHYPVSHYQGPIVSGNICNANKKCEPRKIALLRIGAKVLFAQFSGSLAMQGRVNLSQDLTSHQLWEKRPFIYYENFSSMWCVCHSFWVSRALIVLKNLYEL